MDDKVFDLLEKVYIELQSTKTELKGDINGIKGDIKDLKGNVASIDNRLTKIEIKMENEIKNKIDLLFETQVDINKHFDVIEKKIDDLSLKVDKHDIKIQVIEGGKKKKSMWNNERWFWGGRSWNLQVIRSFRKKPFYLYDVDGKYTIINFKDSAKTMTIYKELKKAIIETWDYF